MRLESETEEKSEDRAEKGAGPSGDQAEILPESGHGGTSCYTCTYTGTKTGACPRKIQMSHHPIFKRTK